MTDTVNEQSVEQVKATKRDIHCEDRKDHYEVLYKDYTFKLLKPRGSIDYLSFVASNDTDEDNSIWLEKLNHYSLIKKPTIKSLLKKFRKLADKNLNARTGTIVRVPEESGREVAFHKERTRIKALMKRSESQLAVKRSKQLRKLFSKEKVADIIVNEYMNMWRYFSESGIGTLSIIGDSAYHWRLLISKFQNTSLRQGLLNTQRDYGYNYVEVDLHFSDVYYPNSPPQVKVIRPRLADSLMSRISNSKQFNLDYWNPTTSIKGIVDRIIDILNAHGRVISTDLNDIKRHPDGAFMPIENVLIDLSTLVDSGEIDPIDKDLKLYKAQLTSSSKKSASGKHYWAKGTGYGHTGAHNWDPSEYTRIQEERDAKIQAVFNRILEQVQNVDKNYESFYESIKGSILIKYLKNQIKSSTLLDMDKHKKTFEKYFTLIQTMCTEHGIVVFHDDSGESLANVIMQAFEISKTSLEVDDTNEMANMVFTVGTMVEDVYVQYLSKLEAQKAQLGVVKETEKKEDDETEEKKKDTKEQIYEREMEKHRFSFCNSIKGFKYAMAAGNMAKCYKRLSVELPSLKSSLPVQYGACVLARICKGQVNKHRYMITGPVDTPYEHGCLIFDAYMSPSYPMKPPDFKFLNTGGNRYNPNLYDTGKVCLSILNTYIGPIPHKSELWIAKESTLYQVVMSILGQILVEEPYFNEPGYERSKGSANGNSASERYNLNIRLYVMKSSMRDLLVNPDSYPEFKDAIRTHFKYKKADILKTLDKWMDDARKKLSTKKAYGYVSLSDYESTYKTIVTELSKL